jgi:vacuolar protein sorting-associated protein 54
MVLSNSQIKRQRQGTCFICRRIHSTDINDHEYLFHYLSRLLADAKYLHQKLSALKNVGAPTGMLETVVTEKRLPRPTSNTNSQAGPSKPPTRSNTLSANQRLKGLLTGRSSSFAQADKDKALPLPERTPSPPPPVPPPTDKPRLSPPSQFNANSIASLYNSNLSQDQFINGSTSQLSLSLSATTTPEGGGSQGFKQVENSQHGSESAATGNPN